MYIDKRWILPGVLSIMLFVALVVVATMAIMNAGDDGTAAPRLRPAASVSDPDIGCESTPAALTAPAPEAAPLPAAGQFSDGGFGDIGQQFQNVNVGAPITNVHISSSGDANTTNTIVGDNNTINNGGLEPPVNAAPTQEPSVEEPPADPPPAPPTGPPAEPTAPSSEAAPAPVTTG